ncbi:uncharacterized protein DS421_3g85740 [Arachis hypogaea]|nr:uncharacterized protein DS421_3g85740 [Arachis hypogaea]
MTTASSRATAVTAEQRNDGGTMEVTVAGLCGATAREDDKDSDGKEPPAAALAQRRRFSLRDGNGSPRAAVRWRIGRRRGYLSPSKPLQSKSLSPPVPQ